jgi:hypothetical protein
VQVRETDSGRLVRLVDVLWPRKEMGQKWKGIRIAATADGFVACYPERNLLRFFDPMSEKGVDRIRHRKVYAEVTHEISADSPVSVASDGDSLVFVLSKGRIIEMSAHEDSEESPRTLIPANRLESPRRIAYAPEKDELLVVHGEKRPNQITRYDLKGKARRTYGREGGRQYGSYNPNDFYRIMSVSPDLNGGFVVTESGPGAVRRTAHFARDGSLIKEWFGGQRWGNFIALDPGNPEFVSYYGVKNIRCFGTIDYDARTWKLTHVCRQPDTEGMFPRAWDHKALWKLKRHADRLYLVSMVGNRRSVGAIFQVDLEGGELVPTARFSYLLRYRDRKNPPSWWVEAVEERGVDWDDHPRRLPADYLSFAWVDRNGDGFTQPEEFTFYPPGNRLTRQVQIDDRWNIYSTGGQMLRNTNPDVMPPRWEWAKGKECAPRGLPEAERDLGRVHWAGMYRDVRGPKTTNYYQLLAGHCHPDGDWQGNAAVPDWPATNIGAARLVKWDHKGRTEWVAARAGHGRNAPPGTFVEPRGILGEAHGCIVAQDRAMHPAMAWTKAGLYAGYFMEKRADDGLSARIYDGSGGGHNKRFLLHDHVLGAMFTTASQGVLWQPSGANTAPLYRIHGWKGWTRQEGLIDVKHVPPHADGEGSGLTAKFFASPDENLMPVLTRVDERIWFGPRSRIGGDAKGRPWKLGGTPKEPGEKSSREQIGMDSFAVRWHGQVEAPLTESYRFVIETQNRADTKMWIDGKKLNGKAHTRTRRTRLWISEPIELSAGEKMPIRVGYTSTTTPPSMHLMWQSTPTLERQHIPTKHLYPEE